MRFDQIAAIKGCLKDACQTSCRLQVDSGLWSLDVCGASDSTTPPDAGTAPPPPPSPSSDGGCQLGRGGGRGAALIALLLLAAFGVRRSRLPP